MAATIISTSRRTPRRKILARSLKSALRGTTETMAVHSAMDSTYQKETPLARSIRSISFTYTREESNSTTLQTGVPNHFAIILSRGISNVGHISPRQNAMFPVTRQYSTKLVLLFRPPCPSLFPSFSPRLV